MTIPKRRVRATVNGQPVEAEVEPRLLLSDFLRHELGLTGTHVGCEHGVCGLLAVAIVAGWGAGLATTIGEGAIGSLFAFLAGGVVLNVLKEELPEERKSRFVPFALGAGATAALLLAL